MDFAQHLSLLLRSGHQLIQIVTVEERRALEDIHRAVLGAYAPNRPGTPYWRIVTWDFVRGFDDAVEESAEACPRNPAKALSLLPSRRFDAPTAASCDYRPGLLGTVEEIHQSAGGTQWSVKVDGRLHRLPDKVGTSVRLGETLKLSSNLGCALEENIVFVFRDPALLLNSQEGLATRRMLRNLVEYQVLSNDRFIRPVILLGAVVVDHPELAAAIVNIDYRLPDVCELNRAVGYIEESLPEDRRAIRPEFRKHLVDSLRGFSRAEADNTLAYLTVMKGGFSADPVVEEEMINSVWDRKRAQWNNSGPLELIDSRKIACFDEVGGYGNLKPWIREQGFRYSERAVQLGIRPPRGMILGGAPGTGKSFVARIVAREMNHPLVIFDISAVFQSLVGGSESLMRECLRRIQALGPCTVLIDEADKALAGMAGNQGGDSGVASRVFGRLLSWQANENTEGAFMVYTMNRPADIPPETFRKGRVDRVFWCDVPTDEERKEILLIHSGKVGKPASDWKPAEMSTILEYTRGWTGADIEQLFLDAQVRAAMQSNGKTGVPAFDQLRDLSMRRRSSGGSRSSIEEMRIAFSELEVEPVSSYTGITSGVESSEASNRRRRLST